MKAEDLGLFRREPAQGCAETLGQLRILGGLGRRRLVAGEGIPVGRLLAGGLPVPLAEAIDGAGGGQSLEQGPPVPYLLAPGYFQGGEERLLKAIIGVGSVSQQPVGCVPNRLPISTEDLRPVRHAALRCLQRSV